MDYTEQQLAARVNLGKHQFAIDATNEEGQAGTFVLHRATAGDELMAEVLASQYLTPPVIAGEPTPPPVELSDNAKAAAKMLAMLNVVTDMRPPWAAKDWRKAESWELVEQVFDKYLELVATFRLRLQGEGGTDRGTAQPENPGVAGGMDAHAAE